jgi:predicted RNA binding protein YcfA (HicA-like mRNA interferase family)
VKPIKRRELIRRLRAFGFTGPKQGGKHPYMERGEETLTLPGEHRRDIGPGLQTEIIRQARISKHDWEKA